MTSTPIFDALAAELLTGEPDSDGTAEVEDQSVDSAHPDLRVSGILE
jgi:hypothetical protein